MPITEGAINELLQRYFFLPPEEEDYGRVKFVEFGRLRSSENFKRGLLNIYQK